MALYSIDNNKQFLADNIAHKDGYEIVRFILIDDVEASWSAVRELALPTDALVDEAAFSIVARPAGRTNANEIAEVRAATPEFLHGDGDYAVVVDFGRMVSVSDVSASAQVKNLLAWSGTKFEVAGNEVNTERLMLEFHGPGQPSDVIDGVFFNLPTIPTGLELAVDGTTVWFQQQGSSAGFDPPESAGVGYVTEQTTAIRNALAAKTSAATDGEVKIGVELRAATPGFLSLDAAIPIRRVHQVAFPDGPSRSVTVDSEGPFELQLPLPAASSGWEVESVQLVGRASLPDHRVIPPSGPEFSDGGRLALSPDRTLLGRLPAVLTDRLASLTGIRVAVRGGDAGGELGGRLLHDADGGTGDPVPGGDLVPATVGPGSDVAWITLATSAPVPAGDLWIELLLSYGELELELTTVADTDQDTPGFALYHRRAGGALRALTIIPEIGPQFGALRLVGLPDRNRPLDALQLTLAGDDAGTLPFTPTRDGTSARIGTAQVLNVSGGLLSLEAVAAVPGSFSFESIQVTYTDVSGSDAAFTKAGSLSGSGSMSPDKGVG